MSGKTSNGSRVRRNGMKENDGRAARQRKRIHLLYLVLITVVTVLLISIGVMTYEGITIWSWTASRAMSSSRYSLPFWAQKRQERQQHQLDFNINPVRKGRRNQHMPLPPPDRHQSHHGPAEDDDATSNEENYESPPSADILSGYLHFIEVSVMQNELEDSLMSLKDTGGKLSKSKTHREMRNDSSRSNNNTGDTDDDDDNDDHPDTPTYRGVYGTFFFFVWSVHKNDPSSVPMFRDVVAQSKLCDSTRTRRIPLHRLIQDVRRYDKSRSTRSKLELNESNNSNKSNESTTPSLLKLGGFVFHESRCGSTLVANLLSASKPSRHRVYSESQPPLNTLKICGEQLEYCSIDTAAQIFRDVVYLMSRTDDPIETTVFFKIQSIGTRHFRVFRHAFPSVPWIFVYRDPVQVMMSHLLPSQVSDKALESPSYLKKIQRRANCVHPQRDPPPIVRHIVNKYNGNDNSVDPSDLDPEDYCAAHLASLTESIVSNFDASTGAVVNYAKLPDILYETIFPRHFHMSYLDPDDIERMKLTATKYSKGRGKQQGQQFTGDNERKEKRATETIRNAATQYLQPSFLELEDLAEAYQATITN